MRATGIPGPYSEAFDNPEAPFLYLYSPSGDGSTAELFTRRRFLSLGRKAATVLHRYGLQPGDRFVNGFGANSPVDLAFRLGAILTGTVPVTVNWQADSPERAAYKVEISKARLLVQEHTFPSGLLRGIEELFPALPVYPVENLDRETPYNGSWPEEPAPEQEKLVIFTSGTTGAPKGVSLTYGNYASNAATFRSFLAPLGLRPLQLVMANPLHHANSSALSDWCMREPGAVIHMLPRYGTAYWRVLAEAASSGGELLAPAVARHIDFLHNLAEEGALPIPEERLREVLPRVHFLLGSAPVGPTTVERIRAWTGRPPLVRFGSTETCLQALGTPTSLSPEESMEAFRRGWHHTPSPGYYIGRPHPPHTEAAVVRSTDPADAGYLVPCPNGEEGYLIARGGHVMAGYLNDTEATREVLRDGWYLGFGDIGFTLTSPADGGRDHYWLGRDSALVIRGGANYACDQISAELTAFLEKRYGIAPSSVDLAVVGMRMESEHEDSCCVTIDTSRLDRETEAELRRSFIEEARRKVSRGARPDRLRFGAVPRNFKGAVRIRELKELWRTETATPENTHREDDDGNAS